MIRLQFRCVLFGLLLLGSIGMFALECSAEAPRRKGRAQLWRQHCMRCHHLISPDQYSDAQWDVITMHMRVRANLGPAEQKAILEFLQAAN